MSHSLNSLKGGYMGDYIGNYYRGYSVGYWEFGLQLTLILKFVVIINLMTTRNYDS